MLAPRLSFIDELVSKVKPLFEVNRDFTPIFNTYGIQFYRHASFPTLALSLNGVPHIFISNRFFQVTQEFSTAHELGHILLQHLDQNAVVRREKEANIFASQLTDHSICRYSALLFLEVAAKHFTMNQRTAIYHTLLPTEEYFQSLVHSHSQSEYR